MTFNVGAKGIFRVGRNDVIDTVTDARVGVAAVRRTVCFLDVMRCSPAVSISQSFWKAHSSSVNPRSAASISRLTK